MLVIPRIPYHTSAKSFQLQLSGCALPSLNAVVSMCLPDSLRHKGQERLFCGGGGLQMWARWYISHVYSAPGLPPSFLPAHVVRGALVYSQLSRWPTSSARNTSKHSFLRTAGPCPEQQPDHPLPLVDRARGQEPLQTQACWTPVKHSTHKGRWLGWGGCCKAATNLQEWDCVHR